MQIHNWYRNCCYLNLILGGDSGRVVIWNIEPVIDETAELDPNVPKMLCQLDNHLGTIYFIFFFIIVNLCICIYRVF